MALKQQTQTKKPSPSLETQGPTMADSGVMPPNPSDAIFSGKPLRTVPAQVITGRRSFSIPTKPTLHYRDGLDGAAETLTVNERRLTNEKGEDIPYVMGPNEVKYPPTQDADWDHAEFGATAGPANRKGGRQPQSSNEFTTNGQPIRGT